MSDCKVERVGRRVIEGQLLTALSKGGVVAILASEEDLRLMIACLRLAPFDTKARQMLADYEQLLNEAFK